MRRFIGSFIVAVLGGIIALFLYTTFVEKDKVIVTESNMPGAYYTNNPGKFDPTTIDFSMAAEKSVDAVVHVIAVIPGREYSVYDLFRWERRTQKEPDRRGSGSGVIISSNGHIVTNNHVVENSKALKVILNDGRVYDAEIEGRDPDTDLAVIKIDEKDLPFIIFGDSDEMKVGSWVLAVGNPYNLYSTVTAGIISAKGRGNIGLISRGEGVQTGIESYIQTDAAVNMGNSGGALVNLRGELIGINSAILSYTGSYSGYSFAIPVTIVKKVIEDIIEYGEVQRAVMGVIIQPVTDEIAKNFKLDKIEGIRVNALTEGGAAEKGGMEIGDIILEVNGDKVNSNAELLEKINTFSPGDKVSLNVKRNNARRTINLTLLKKDSNANTIYSTVTYAGAELSNISESEMEQMKLKNGVKVTEIGEGTFKDAGIRKGFIITDVNEIAVQTPDDVVKICEEAKRIVLIEGRYPNGRSTYYHYRK